MNILIMIQILMYGTINFNKLFIIIVLSILILELICIECTGEDTGDDTSDGIPPASIVKRPISDSDSSLTKISYGGSSNKKNVLSTESSPINITRMIISPRMEGCFFKADVIEVLVKVTSLKKDRLESVEIWEKPDDNLEILSCSYPIRTSSIKEIFDYEETDKSFLREDDLKNSIYIIKLLKNESCKEYPLPSNNSSWKLYSYIYSLLSPHTQEILDSYGFRENDDYLLYKLKYNIIKDFNEIIDAESSLDLNASLLSKYKIPFDRENVLSFNPHSIDFIESKDHRLIKRRLLERIFPGMLTNLSFYKDHEDLKIQASPKYINILGKSLYQGESIVFKYYLRPQELGRSEIRSIIKTKGFLDEEIITLDIIERGERFNIDYWCESKDLTCDCVTKFIYYIEYLGGNDETSDFTVRFQAPEGCEIGKNIKWKDSNGSWYPFLEPVSCLNFEKHKFSRGKIEELAVNVTYTKTGQRISPPTISIGNFTKEFEADICIYGFYDNFFKVHFEALSIFFLFITVFLSMSFSFYEGYKTYLLWKNNRNKNETPDK
ncbi:MAG: hypothetical protein HPY61_06235 [Methanotrichaceae archaeon]|nr:hypothetical protein [Methanotrichaceae archaeon]